MKSIGHVWEEGRCLARNLLRWPDTIYLHIGRLFSIQIFDHSAVFDCRDILDAEKEMLEVYQKRTFIEIHTNLRKFSLRVQ